MEGFICRAYVLLLVLIRCHVVRPANVLSIPQNANSHVNFHAYLAQALSDQGHKVDMLLPSNVRVPSFITSSRSRVTVVEYQVPGETPYVNSEEFSQLFLGVALENSTFGRLKSAIKMVEALQSQWALECEELFKNEQVKNQVSSAEYDIVIMDTAGLFCKAAYPYSLRLPMVMYGIYPFEWLYGVPVLPSFVPSGISQLSDDMSFLERLQNTLLYVVSHLTVIRNSTAYDKFAGDLPKTDSVDILKHAEMIFQLDDMSLSYSKPSMPNVVYIGDIMGRPSNPLPTDLSYFVESATEGVILVSFGSFFDHLPDNLIEIFCKAFVQLPQKILWKMSRENRCVEESEGIMTMDWLPQNDLLGHDNVKLFISHCGISSVIESVYHATPILGIPIAVDQPYNAARVQNKGLGLKIEIRELTENNLVSAIVHILGNETIAENLKMTSEIMKDKLETPGERASYWINHIVEHGSSHLKTGALGLNVLQFYLIDVYLCLLFFLVVVICVLYAIGRCCIRSFVYCFGKCRRKTKVD